MGLAKRLFGFYINSSIHVSIAVCCLCLVTLMNEGVELEAAYDSEYFFSNAAYGLTIGNNLTENTALTTVAPPEITLTAGIQFKEHGLKFGWDGRFVFEENKTENSGTDDENFRREAHQVHDIFASWTSQQEGFLGGWEVSARLENVADTYYRDFLANDNGKGRTAKISIAKTVKF